MTQTISRKSVRGGWTAPLRRAGLGAGVAMIRQAFSVRVWQRLLADIRTRRFVKASGLVDADWYVREYPEVAEKGIDPVQDFLTPPHPRIRLPNPDFVPGEYAAVNYDVKASKQLWAVHYVRHGMRESRPISSLETSPKPFPRGAKELRQEFPAVPAVHRRTALFASFSGDGRIPDSVLYYLRGLKEVVDNIVFVADNPIFPDEIGKLEGLVRLAVFQRHGRYDFGSYKAGWTEAKRLGLLDPDLCDELVVCNDSCYGPIFPFQEMFGEMKQRDEARPGGRRTDFWGTAFTGMYGRPAIQSFFYVFRKAVLEGSHLDRWFSELNPPTDRGLAIVRCEATLTRFLVQFGYKADAFAPASFYKQVKATPTKYPLSLMRDHRMPLLKKKSVAGDSLEDLEEVRRFVQSANPEIAAFLPPPGGRKESPLSAARTRREEHVQRLAETAESLRQSHAAGQPVRILFLTTSSEIFHGGPVFSQCLQQSDFPPRIAVVPDMRIDRMPERLAAMRDVRAHLFALYPKTAFGQAETDLTEEWNDVTAEADVVCWETAENASDFHYNPHYAVGRDFLPVLFFDRRTAGPYPPEKEFARQNYAYFWKIFFDDPEDFRLYAAHSLRRGENAVLIPSGDWGAGVFRVLKTELGG